MNRRRLALIFAFLFAIALSSAAYADVSSIEVTLTPEELTEPGQVSVDIIIKNTSDSITMEDATLEGPQINAYSVGNIAPLGTRGLQIPGVRISADQLGNEFYYKLSWTESGARQEKNIPILVRGRAGTPKLIASRSVDKEILRAGETATLSYVIQNQGDVDLENITITDPIFAEPVTQGLRLGVGEAAQTITKDVTMADAALRSAPKVTYSAQGQSGSVDIEALEIGFASADLSVEVRVAETAATGTKLAIVLTNNGNVTLAGMVIRDELGNEIESGAELAPGESTTIDHTVISPALRRFQVRVEGADEQGVPFTAQSSPAVEIKPLIDPTGVVLEFTSDADISKHAETGKADVTFKITLGGDVVLSDAVITEDALGEVMSLGVLNPGETTRIQSFDITGDTQLRFSLRAVDSAGNPHTQAAKTLDITFSEPTPPPQDQPTPSPTPAPAEPIQGTLLTLIIVIAVLLVAAIVALVVLLIQDKRNKGARQDEMEELEEMLESPKLSTKKPQEDEPWEDEPEDKPKFKLPRVPTRPPVRPSQGLPEGLRSTPPPVARATQPPAVPPATRAAQPAAPPQPPRPASPVRQSAPPLPVQKYEPLGRATPPKAAPPRTAPPPRPAAPARTAPPPRPEAPVSNIPPLERPAPMRPSGVQPPYQPPIQPPPIQPSFDSGWDELDDEF